jgi:hypothetical protein
MINLLDTVELVVLVVETVLLNITANGIPMAASVHTITITYKAIQAIVFARVPLK